MDHNPHHGSQAGQGKAGEIRRIPVTPPATTSSDSRKASRSARGAASLFEIEEGAPPAGASHVPSQLWKSCSDSRPSDRVAAGQEFAWSVKVLSDQRKEIRSSVPVRVQLRDGRGRILSERFAAATSGALTGTCMAPLNAPENELALEATELFSGLAAQLPLHVMAPDQPIRLMAATIEPRYDR